MKGHKKHISVTVNPDLVRDLDLLRGLIPRSRVVEGALSAYVQSQRMRNKEGVGVHRLQGETPNNATVTTTLDHGISESNRRESNWYGGYRG